MRNASLVVALLLLTQTGFAQLKSAERLAKEHIETELSNWQLSAEDIEELRISDEYASSHNGVTHLYFQQLYKGIEIINAVSGVHLLPNGKIGYATNSFERDLANRVQHSHPVVDAVTAIRRSAIHLGVDASASLELVRENGANDRIYQCQKISAQEITAQLKYYCIPETREICLVWNISIAPNRTNDQWEVKVDARTGNIVGKNNLVIKCRFPASGAHAHTSGCYSGLSQLRSWTAPPRPGGQPVQGEETRYNVFPIPVESPNHGERKIVASPADDFASPYGWHDVNGDGEPDYTFTRGNNAHVYLDLNADDELDQEGPDVGESLVFDFPFDQNAPPDSNTNAAMVQAFYMVNVLHDFAYHYGFDEAAGNFQNNNRGMGGNGQDHVLVEVQDGSDINNATFATPMDGINGRMQVYLWDQGQGKLMEVLEPEVVSGKYEAGTAGYGPPISEEEALEGIIAEAFDGTRDDSDKGCETIINPEDVEGKIAMVNRGVCFFQQKTLNAEEAGAIALIICNFEDNIIGLGGVEGLSPPQIPTVSLKSSDCEKIRLALNDGVRVKLQIPPTTGPEFRDASFDNGVVAHEFAHGISTRLTGGPAQSGCLNNDEQMGEGWSDFFTLIMTARPEEAGTTPRGIGTYLLREDIDDTGIRRKPYSISTSINDQYYEDIMGTGSPHALGEVWTSVLWDLYWEFVEVYGWDEDIYAGNGGNNMAVQLVMDGMKLQNCQPGFLDGRNAILAADLLNFDGQNQCLIWDVFARRGLGWNADQNSNLLRDDAIAGFDVMPECIKTLKLAKTVTPNIDPGEDIIVTFTVTNHRDEMVENVAVNDEIPAGTQFAGLEDAQGIEPEMSGQEINFLLGSLRSGDSRTFSYRLSSSPDLFSTELYFNDFEVEDFQFIPDNVKRDTNTNVWRLDNTLAASGEQSWFIPSTPLDVDQALVQLEPIELSAEIPTLFFKQHYAIEPGNDGGVVEISTNGGLNWEYLPADKFFRRGYTGRLNYQALTIPFLRGFWGETKRFVDTYADLSDYAGQAVQLRFRFGSDDEGQGGTDPGRGWNIDDLMIFDLFNYNTEACVSGDGAGTVCARATGKGTVVNTSSLVATNTASDLAQPLAIQVFPNPSHNRVNVRVSSTVRQDFDLQVFTTDGKLMHSANLQTGQNTVTDHTLNIDHWPEGIYIVKTITPQVNLVEKFIKN